MAIVLDCRTGPVVNQDGPGDQPLRQSRMAALVMTQGHSRFFEACSRGYLFSVGLAATALSANTITLVAATTPILGVWNPPASTVNLVMLQAAISVHANTLTAPVMPGPFVWASSVGNSAISTGLAPFNRKTMASSGSQAKGFAGATALTGLTNNLVIFEGSELPDLGILVSAGTITAQTTTSNATAGAAGVENFDGGLIVPPGGVLALLNTTSTTTTSVAGRLLWEEVPL